ncbi:WD40 repeat domain-containing protein [Paenibacillus woosongensis]|uniref:WD40 repeat domain-containing protein n=1 Tax=Paenibacillus woosongensis TaxID=307580 RepID=A0AA95IDD3_9BACL|nr:WD40 repeat domain-containing protein [Paenibacillus woosongensis]WHX50900.1 WD40 repeat domain-containing protein [Paenibacillus woosongensis]
MKMNRRNYIAGLLAATLLSAGMISGCNAAQEGRTAPVRSTPDVGSLSSAETGGGKRELTVVKEGKPPAEQGIAVQRIHRIEGANIEKWLSDDELEIEVTALEKEATATEGAQYSHRQFRLDLESGQRQSIAKQPGASPGEVIKSFLSPDGKYSFIQTWKNKYTVENAIENMATGERREVTVDNYIEVGGWLNNDSYILAAGSVEDLGVIWKISVDGTRTKIKLQDSEVDYFIQSQFAVGNGKIYYTDAKNRLKSFTPTQARPTVLAKDISAMSLSPDSQRIAVTSRRDGQEEENLLIYDTSGHVQGLQIGKGDVVSDQSWSPDSSKLAFAVYTEDQGGMNGIYIFDTVSGKVSPLGLSYYPTYPLSWNPSGTRLGITVDDNEKLVVTYIVDFKP